MAGTIPLSMTQQFDEFGEPLAGGLLYIYQAGTVGTFQNPYQDFGLTITHPNPMPLDAAGRIPLFYLADGFIKFRLVNAAGVQQLAADNVLVIGPSSGSGGGGGVDPTTQLQTGMLVPYYGKLAQNVLTGFCRSNGLSIGNALSSATERVHADTLALFTLLWNNDPNLIVYSGGLPVARGANAAADFGANRAIALPDLRGRVIACLDDHGNVAINRLTSSYFGASGIVLGAAGGDEKNLLSATHIPNAGLSVSGTTGNDSPDHTHNYTRSDGVNASDVTPGSVIGIAQVPGAATGGASTRHQHPFSANLSGGGGQAHANVQPAMVMSYYIKL